MKCITGPGSERGGASKRETKTASVDDMNGLIVHALCNSLLPLWDAKQRYEPCYSGSVCLRSSFHFYAVLSSLKC